MILPKKRGTRGNRPRVPFYRPPPVGSPLSSFWDGDQRVLQSVQRALRALPPGIHLDVHSIRRWGAVAPLTPRPASLRRGATRSASALAGLVAATPRAAPRLSPSGHLATRPSTGTRPTAAAASAVALARAAVALVAATAAPAPAASSTTTAGVATTAAAAAAPALAALAAAATPVGATSVGAATTGVATSAATAGPALAATLLLGHGECPLSEPGLAERLGCIAILRACRRGAQRKSASCAPCALRIFAVARPASFPQAAPSRPASARVGRSRAGSTAPDPDPGPPWRKAPRGP